MTIHSDWSRILHEECSEAFSSRAPRCSLGIGIIDGHLQLMRLDERMRTWECFIRNQFLKPIQTLFHLGCPRVVLCFDNYHAVPIYKSMTQVLRSSRHQEVRVFDPEDALPSAVPDEPMLYLMNRNFKLRLIEMLCERIPSMVELQAGQELILDYKRVVRYTPGCRVPVLMPGMESMGESDVKFCRYVSRFGNALVHAIDGDYMAIALLYYTQHPKRLDNQIFIYRQLSVLQSTSSTQSAKKKKEAGTNLCDRGYDPIQGLRKTGAQMLGQYAARVHGDYKGHASVQVPRDHQPQYQPVLQRPGCCVQHCLPDAVRGDRLFTKHSSPGAQTNVGGATLHLCAPAAGCDAS